MRQLIYVLLRSLLDFAGIAALVPVIFMLAERLGNERRLTLLLCAAVLLFIVVKNLAILLLARSQIRYQLAIYRHISRQMFENYYGRGLMFLKKKSSVKLAYEVNGVALTFSQYVIASLFSLLGDGLLILLLFAALMIWKPVMGLMICAIFLPMAMLYARLVREKVRRIGAENLKAQRAQSRTVVETFRGYAEMEIAGAFNSAIESFDRNLDIIENNRKSMEIYRLFPAFLSEIAVVAGLIILVAFGGNNVMITGGIFAVAAFRIIPAVRNMLNCWSVIQNNATAIDIVAEGLQAPQTVTGNHSVDTTDITFNKGITVNNLSFSFPDGHRLLNNLSFNIAPGERIGIRGRSGVGKSTLFNLLLGFLKPTSGTIYIDDTPLNDNTRRAWYGIVGYVPQEIFIAEGSLAQNIAPGQKDIDLDRVMHVLEQVQLSQWAMQLEKGLDTDLGEYGNRLSGGQKQRIGIARALYKGARVLFFDEATSSLDSRTEHEINEALEQLSQRHRELTMIIIAHRESSLAICDRIIDLPSIHDNNKTLYP